MQIEKFRALDHSMSFAALKAGQKSSGLASEGAVQGHRLCRLAMSGAL